MLEVTDILVKLASDRADKLLAYVEVVLCDGFVIKDLKIIQAADGERFLAMPSRHVCDHCQQCDRKNRLDARWCHWCGVALDPTRGVVEGQLKLHVDVCHPISREARQALEDAVFGEYERLVAQRCQAAAAR